MTKKPADDSSIETLVRLAGERDAPSVQGVERARAAAFASWQEGLRASQPSRAPRSPKRRAVWWSAAAGFVALASGIAMYRVATSPQLVARVATVNGDVTSEGASNGVPMSGAPVLAGDAFETRSGRLALAFGALSLRLDRNTKLRIDEQDRVTLLEGQIYVDSGGVNALTVLRIVTPAGDVRHVGTQFQVGVASGVTRVQVREGRVTLQPARGAAHEVAAGETLKVGDTIELTSSHAAFGAAWEWVTDTAPAFDIESRPLGEFLAWIAREHGWQVIYRDAALQSSAQTVRLHGSLDGLDSVAMIERVSLISGIPMGLREGELTVGAASSSP
jgi:ferric-dicitrate binding protein FerR (iron transport regulator)